MKITTFILLVACLKVSANASAQQVTLSQKNVSIEKVFKEIKKQVGYSFLYTDELVQKATKVTVEAKNTPLTLFLDQLFMNQPLSYVIVDQTIIVKSKVQVVPAAETPAAIAPPIKITGKITGENNAPLEAVSVVVKGTKMGTSTSANGTYSITVAEPGVILVFSSIGYETKEVKVTTSSTEISFTMLATSIKMEELVVVGYGSQKKKDVTGSVVSIGEKALHEVPVANLQQALQGRAAGLEVQQVGTRPGAGAVIRIRGERTINGSNDPLIILDGIPFEGGNLNDINPDEVASVDVLKDASATAIYGSRGSNGVILITTKKGKPGESKLSYNGYYGIASVRNRYQVFNANEYVAMRDLANNASAPYMPEELASRVNGLSTNWQDLMYQNGFVTNHNLSVSGGTSSGSTYSLGGGYFKETTVLPGQNFGRYSLRATIDTKIGKKLKIGLNTMNTLSITNGSQFNNPMFPIITLSPLMPSTSDTTVAGNTTDRPSQYNPLLLKNNNGSWVDKVRRLRTFNTLYAEYQITTGLKYRLNVGLDYRLQENNQFQKSDKPLSPSYFRAKKGNTATVNNAEGYGYTLENILTYDKTIGKHKFTFTGLYSFQEDRSHNTLVSKDSIDEDFIQFYNLGQASASNTSKPTVSGSETTYALESYMARLNYSFNEKYMATLTYRLDGSSRLAPGNKYKSYPALSFGWNISSEDFMKKITFLDILKLRAGVGQTSNQSISPYTSLGLVSPYNYNGYYSPSAPGGTIRYNYGPTTIVTGYNLVTLPNPNLDWEYTKTINLGLDFSFLKGRISGSLEWYKSSTNNILYGIALPVTSGVAGNYTTNIGEMENKGLEFTVSTINVKKQNFSWSTDLNLFGNRNKLLKLNDGFKNNIGSQLFIGQPLSAIYDYNKLGVWQISEAAEAAKYGNKPGDIKLEDLNGDGKFDPANDRKVIGSGQAKIQGGITNRFTYKNFDFSFVVYARFGGLLVSQVYQPFAAYTNLTDGVRNAIKTNYWTPTNPTNDFPIANFTSRSRPITTDWTTLGYYDASFIKVRSINFGYTLSPSLISKLKIQSLRAYIAVQNPFVLYSPYMRKIGGVDPEATGTGNQGVQNPGNLSSRALTIGLNTPPTVAVNVGLNITL
ncbi:MAG: TonB-dependent receptor [Flavobacterium sp.]|nr:TonB-dependent receptor [Flavobacterium sp.]